MTTVVDYLHHLVLPDTVVINNFCRFPGNSNLLICALFISDHVDL